MTELDDVVRCPLRMQRCGRGEKPCPLPALEMGVDRETVVAVAKECWWAGEDLLPYYYRGLSLREQGRWGRAMAAKLQEARA